MTAAEILDFLNKAGTLGMFILITLGGWKGWYVWGHLYRDALEERDEWKRMALAGTHLADTATQHLTKERRPPRGA